MAETITFNGSVRINEAASRYKDKLPFLVEVWDDDDNMREEALERKFKTQKSAERYARSIAPRCGYIPVMKEDEPGPARGWSTTVLISGAA
jgi:hypothetical protein